MFKTVFVVSLFPLVFSAVIRDRGSQVQIPVPPSSTWEINPSNTSQSRDCSTFRNYTALGDSIAAGITVGTRLPLCKPGEPTGRNSCTTDTCKKWTGSYANAFAQKYHVQDFRWLGCAGANTDDVIRNQLNPLDFGSPSLVTIHAGANNDGLFQNTAWACLNPWGDCDGAVGKAEHTIKNVRNKTMHLIDQIRKLAPNALIVIMGYYQFWDINSNFWFCQNWLIKGNFPKMNMISQKLDDALKIPAAPNLIFVDVDSSFAGHRLCSTKGPLYIFAPYPSFSAQQDGGLFHPNANGHADMLRQLEAALVCG